MPVLFPSSSERNETALNPLFGSLVVAYLSLPLGVGSLRDSFCATVPLLRSSFSRDFNEHYTSLFTSPSSIRDTDSSFLASREFARVICPFRESQSWTQWPPSRGYTMSFWFSLVNGSSIMIFKYTVLYCCVFVLFECFVV